MSKSRVILAALSLAACTSWGAGPDISAATQNQITIRYDATTVDPREAEAVAISHCMGWDKEAKLRTRFADSPDMTYVDYSCVAPQKKKP